MLRQEKYEALEKLRVSWYSVAAYESERIFLGEAPRGKISATEGQRVATWRVDCGQRTDE
jgi:hypothetical protein